MVNILVPMAGTSHFFENTEYHFPKPLIEIGSMTMIERVIRNLSACSTDVAFTFIVSQSDCDRYHIDRTLSLLTGDTCNVVRISRETSGSACSALLAIDHISVDEPLLIANSDQIFDDDLSKILSSFNAADGGVVTFTSVHPRWSYARVDSNNNVVEVAEKKPVSRHAIAGLYYFSKGADFIASAKEMISKDENVDGKYFVAPCFNQMILRGKRVINAEVSVERYHTLYSPRKVEDFLAHLS